MRFGRSLLAGSAVVALALGVVWVERRPIAAGAIDRALAARGVSARYVVTDIGFRTQRLDRISLGDPAHPDLTADWAIVELTPSFSGITVRAIRASGVRLSGKVENAKLTLGSIDRLLPKPSGKAFTLPAIDVDLRDARLSLATALGAVEARLDGRGPLTEGFRGRATIRSAALGRPDCKAALFAADVDVAVTDRHPVFAGPVAAKSFVCAGTTLDAPEGNVRVTLNEALSRWNGSATVAAARLDRANARLNALSGTLDFDGAASRTGVRGSLRAGSGEVAGTRFAQLRIDGDVGLGSIVSGTGRARLSGVKLPDAALNGLRDTVAATAQTPVGPLMRAISEAIGRAGMDTSVSGNWAVEQSNRGTVVRVDSARAQSKSGATLSLSGGSGLTVTPDGVTADSRFVLAGGGFPDIRGPVTAARDGTIRSVLTLAPFASSNARLATSPILVVARRDGTIRVETSATLDGPLPGGRVEGLAFPVVVQRSAAGVVQVGSGCVPLSFRRLAIAGSALDPARIALCPTDSGAIVTLGRAGVTGGVRTGSVRLTGRVGESPLALTVAKAALSLNGPVFVTDFKTRLGAPDRLTRVDIGRIDGRFGPRGLSGQFDRLAGAIGGVPLSLASQRGRFGFADGVLDLDAGIRVSDSVADARFEPLVADAAHLRLKDGRVTATAALKEPLSAKPVTGVAIVHDLSSGSGHADLKVRDLFFGKSLQPEALTRLTVGIVANVQGSITGDGAIRWTRDKVTSSGRFTTDGLDFAAAFGPVSGAAGTIVFDDLLAMTTPPGQEIKLALVNPGVEVRDGTIAYRLLPGQRVAIERGQWAFAGGTLLLDPATLDFGQPVARRLAFRITGLDAARFIETLQLQDIAATGIFDGTLPIVFDETGGRISGGRIVAREGGGRLAYVGDVSNMQTNAYSKLAFDALKSIRYQNLAIDLDGDLDGEIISKVSFTGTNQSPVKPTGLLKSFTNLPFKFNIVMRAPFRGLVNTARGLQDPSVLLDDQQKSVQPPASVTQP